MKISLSILCLVHLVHSAPSALLKAQGKYDLYRAHANEAQKAILEKRKTGCTLDNVIIRKEWGTLSLPARKEYTDAVLCLRTLPPITPLEVVPGVRSRFDDLHAAHINQTAWVHLSAYFLPWHRYFVHAWEKALRDECGYNGAQPYWDWSAADAVIGNNVLFSGPGSIGGNGESIEHDPTTMIIPTTPPSVGQIAPGTGGGCVLDGPFANMTNNLGPRGPPIVTNAFEYNPRCIRRDFRPSTIQRSLTYTNITAVLERADFHSFANALDGVHSAGHAGIGGMNDDLYGGNGDPAFYFHHAQVDHIWTLWQAQDFSVRLNQVTKTLTISNSPPSANGTLDTTMDMGYNGKSYTIKELASTIDGPFCYIYE